MSKIIDYLNNPDITKQETEILYKTFINFYLYFKKNHEKKHITDETIQFLDMALDFSEPVHENSKETNEYLIEKENQLEQFLQDIKDNYEIFEKTLIKLLDIENTYSYEEFYDLITQSYAAYATTRYNQNLHNTKTLEASFTTEQLELKLPKYIPDKNVNITELIEIVNGIKRTSNNGNVLEWFNIFNDNLHIRVIVDTVDGQISSLFINGLEFITVSNSLIRKIKNAIKKGVGVENLELLQQKNKK